MPKRRPARMAGMPDLNEEEIMKISMAVREAAVNAVLHGKEDPNKKVTLAFERQPTTCHRHPRSGQRARRQQNSGSIGARQPDEESGHEAFPWIRLVCGRGGNPPVPNGHRLRMIKHVPATPRTPRRLPVSMKSVLVRWMVSPIGRP